MFKVIIFILIQAYWLCSTAAMAAECALPERGINLAGAEFGPGRIPGKVNYDYRFPTAAKIQYYDEARFNAIRLPFIWERLQPVLYGALDPAYLALIIKFLDDASLQNQHVLLDLHNYGRYRGNIVGTEAVPAKAFRDVWKRLAQAVGNHRALLAYGLMNEPHDTGGRWHQVAQAGVDGVRMIDPSHYIYVAGDGWSNAHRWPSVNPTPFVTDPSGLVVYEAHVYFDADYSGRYLTSLDDTVNLPLLVEKRLQPFIDWLAKYGQRGVIGEWGVPGNDPRWLLALDKFLDVADQNCLGWFYWAGGMWWSDAYVLSLEPINGVDRPQMQQIRQRLQ
ncbi:MAG: glycoside hydrolase family 5 protein [Methylobacter sp.]|uniref:glycoside hydrolase family 5 protein n=1 Tax=Methylobacter sp. TaxID=2051955 RepID=UPI002730D2EB|nr:glycoside hydrolase family 5 protein [Methylobacter sp.]MDP1664540.1 glycoside hydrolase family 5 protein [Methylobacter sp.]